MRVQQTLLTGWYSYKLNCSEHIFIASYWPISKQLLSESLSCSWQPFLSSWFSLLFSLSSALCWWPWVLTAGGADVRLPAAFSSPRGAVATPTDSEEKNHKEFMSQGAWSQSNAGRAYIYHLASILKYVIWNNSKPWLSISDSTIEKATQWPSLFIKNSSSVTLSGTNNKLKNNLRMDAEMVRLLFVPSKPVALDCFSEALVWTLLGGLQSASGGCSSPW